MGTIIDTRMNFFRLYDKRMKWLILLPRDLQGTNSSLVAPERLNVPATYRILNLRILKRGKSTRPQDVPQLGNRILLHLLQSIQILLRPDTFLEQDLKVRLPESDACEELHYRCGTVVLGQLHGSRTGNLWLGRCEENSTRRRGCGYRGGMPGTWLTSRCSLLGSHGSTVSAHTVSGGNEALNLLVEASQPRYDESALSDD
jgi:hypothetical protein